MNKLFKITLYPIALATIVTIIYMIIYMGSFRSYVIFGDLTQSFLPIKVEAYQDENIKEFFGTIIINTDEYTEHETLDKLLTFYIKASKRYKIKSDIDKVTIMINDEFNNRTLQSIMLRDEIYKIDWKNIKTYSEFKKRAFVSTK